MLLVKLSKDPLFTPHWIVSLLPYMKLVDEMGLNQKLFVAYKPAAFD